MKILITGGGGFIGSHIAERILADGHEVAIVDDLSGGVNYAPQGATLIERSILAEGHRRGVAGVQLDGTDAVVHCAAYANLRNNWDDAGERMQLLRDNIIATQALLEAMPAVPIVFLSSASVYGSGSSGGDRDEHGHRCAWEKDASAETCESPYAATKLAGEALVAAYAFKRGTPWHALRLVNVVGPRVHRGVIVDFVRMMRDKGAIHAADDGRQTKPWVHVLDVADVVVRCLDRTDRADVFEPSLPGTTNLRTVIHGQRPVPSGVYNVTSRELISWHDVIDAMGIPRDQVTHEDRDRGAVGDPHNLRVSGDKLAQYYRPVRSVREGIEEALQHLGWTP